MLDEKDLQAIAQLMEKQKQDIMSETKGLLAQQKQDIMHDVKVLLDTEVTTLAIRTMNQEIAELKKAQ